MGLCTISKPHPPRPADQLHMAEHMGQAVSTFPAVAMCLRERHLNPLPHPSPCDAQTVSFCSLQPLSGSGDAVLGEVSPWGFWCCSPQRVPQGQDVIEDSGYGMSWGSDHHRGGQWDT